MCPVRSVTYVSGRSQNYVEVTEIFLSSLLSQFYPNGVENR